MKNVLLILLVVLSFSINAQNHENDTLLPLQATEFVPKNDTLYCNHLDEVNQLIYKNQFEDCENIYEVYTISYIYELTKTDLSLERIEKVWDYALKERTTTFQLSSKSTTEEKSIVYNWESKMSAIIVIKTDQIDTWGYTAWINEVNDTIQKYPFLIDQWHGISFDRIDYGGYNYVTLQMKWNKGVLVDVINENVVFIKGYKKKMLEEDFIEIINNQTNGPIVYPVLVPYELHKGVQEDIILFTEKSFFRTSNEMEFYERIEQILKRVKKSYS